MCCAETEPPSTMMFSNFSGGNPGLIGCLFFLLTINGRNEAIIVELKELFVLNGTFITCSGGSHH